MTASSRGKTLSPAFLYSELRLKPLIIFLDLNTLPSWAHKDLLHFPLQLLSVLYLFTALTQIKVSYYDYTC